MDAHRIHIVDGESLNDNIDGAYLCFLVSVFVSYSTDIIRIRAYVRVDNLCLYYKRMSTC